MSVRYLPGQDELVDAEYRSFFAASEDDAADSLAVINRIAFSGFEGLPRSYVRAFGTERPFCHEAGGWAVLFDVVSASDGFWTVTLLMVANLALVTREAARREAGLRAGNVAP